MSNFEKYLIDRRDQLIGLHKDLEEEKAKYPSSNAEGIGVASLQKTMGLVYSVQAANVWDLKCEIDKVLLNYKLHAPVSESAKMESAAQFVWSCIQSIDHFEQIPAAERMVAQLVIVFGETVQCKAWADSLHLDIYNKKIRLEAL